MCKYNKELALRPEKITAREHIARACKEWILAHRDGGIVVSLPAKYAIMEKEILAYIKKLKQEAGCKVKLITCDIGLHEFEIDLPYDGNECTHQRGNIFDVVANQTKQPMFVWFDLCGPLSDKNQEGLKKALPKMAEGSQYYITLSVHGIRGGISSVLRETYNRSGNTPTGNMKITEEIVNNINVSSVGSAETPIYRQIYGVQTKFAVLGYNINQNQQPTKQTTSMDYKKIASLSQRIHDMEMEVEQLKRELQHLVFADLPTTLTLKRGKSESSQTQSSQPRKSGFLTRSQKSLREERRSRIIEIFKREAAEKNIPISEVNMTQREVARRLGVTAYAIYNSRDKLNTLERCGRFAVKLSQDSLMLA